MSKGLIISVIAATTIVIVAAIWYGENNSSSELTTTIVEEPNKQHFDFSRATFNKKEKKKAITIAPSSKQLIINGGDALPIIVAPPPRKSSSSSSSSEISTTPKQTVEYYASKYLLSKRYNQSQEEYDKQLTSQPNNQQAVQNFYQKYLKDLSQVDLVTEINGYQIEPIDTFIQLGGKRLKKLKLLGNEKLKKDPKFFDSEVNKNKRRYVWFDLGARVWPKGSTMWFSRNYPYSKEFEVECYDVLDLLHTYPKNPPFKSFHFHTKAAWTRNGTVTIGGKKMAAVAFDKQKLDPKKVTIWETQAIDFADLLERNFNKEKEDVFVVVKMDIEGGEWPLMKHLEQTGALRLIDELMLECHPPPLKETVPKNKKQKEDQEETEEVESEFTTSSTPWKAKKHGEMPTDCVRLINRMRLTGIHTHGWF
jgi:hypothetical protein